MTAYERVIEILEEQNRLAPSTWSQDQRVHCPGPLHHRGDERPSLSIKEREDGNVLLYCYAGCPTEKVVAALGLEMKDLFDDNENPIIATYYYEDKQGVKRWRKHRHTDSPKFTWDTLQHEISGPRYVLGTKGSPGLYNLAGVRSAVQRRSKVYLVDGEKDADNLNQLGFTATTLPHGCSSWKSEYGTDLRDADLVIIADDDDPGRKGAEKVFQELQKVAANCEIRLPASPAKDVTDQITNLGAFDPRVLRPFELAPVWDDWDEEIPEIDWVVPGVLAKGSLVWAYGSKETSKSLYFMGVSAALSHRGRHTALYSEEMPLSGDKRRIARFGPDKRYFHWKNGRGLSLDDEEQLLNVIQECRGFDLVVFDSYSKVWRGYGNGNRDAIQCARSLSRIINATGACVVMIDHVGFPFLDANGNQIDQNHPRGASAKEQQADMSILFKESGRWAGPGTDFHFTMTNMKPGRLENPFKRPMRITDTEGGGLAVVGDPYIDEVNGNDMVVASDTAFGSSVEPEVMDSSSSGDSSVPADKEIALTERVNDPSDSIADIKDSMITELQLNGVLGKPDTEGMTSQEKRALGRLRDAFK